MDRNTVVRIAIPIALYEAVKGKVLNEEAISSNPEIKELEKEIFDALNDPKVTALIQQGIAKMKPEDKEKLAKVTMSEGEGGDFSSFQSMVNKFVDKATMKEYTNYDLRGFNPDEDEAKSEVSKAAGTVIKNIGTANIMSMGFLPAILATVTDYIGGTHIVDSVAKAVGDGSAAAILSVAGGLVGGAILWKIGSMLKGEKVSGDTPLFEVIKRFIKEEAKKKPSAGMSEKEKSAVAKKAKAGKDIGKKGKGFEKVAAKAAKEYGSKEAGKKVAAAQMWKAQAGKKKMNENMNTEYGTGDSHEVVFVNQRGGSFTYFIGTREECEQYIEDNEGKLPEDVEIYRR